MVDESKAPAAAVSKGLRIIKTKTGLSFDILADALDLKSRTSQSYYGQCDPSMVTAIRTCNQFRYPINKLLEPLITHSHDQQYIAQMQSYLSGQPTWKVDKISRTLGPLVQAVADGVPGLAHAGFGKRVRVLRDDSSVSALDFSNSCSIAVDTLKNIESGPEYPSVQGVCDICNALHASPKYLLVQDLTYLQEEDILIYSLTLRQMKGLAQTVSYLCGWGYLG